MRRFVLCLLLLRCSHPPPPKPPPPVVEVVRTPTEEVEGVLAELYEALEAGDAERAATVFTDDAMIYGLGPSDTWSKREPFAARLGQDLIPLGLSGDALQVADSRPVVGFPPGSIAKAESAWMHDLPRVTVGHKGSSAATWLPRVTAHLLRDENGWKIDALHASLPVDDRYVFAPEAIKQLLPPADVANERGPDSEELVGLTRRLLDDFELKINRTADRDDFVEIGTSPTEVFERGKTFKALVRAQLPAIRKDKYVWKVDGNLRVHRAPDGLTGWAAGNVVLHIGAGKKVQVLPAFRALWIYVQEKDTWNLASEHQSLALREDARPPSTPDELKGWKEARAARKPKPPPPDEEPAMKPW